MAAASDDPPPPSAFADDVAPTTTSSPPGERAGGRWSSSTSSVAFDPDMSGREGVGVGGRRRWVWRWILIMLHSRGAAGSPHLRNKSHDVYQKREIKMGAPFFVVVACMHALFHVSRCKRRFASPTPTTRLILPHPTYILYSITQHNTSFFTFTVRFARVEFMAQPPP